MRIDVDIAPDPLERVDDLARRRNWTREQAFDQAIAVLLAEPDPKLIPTREEVEAVLNRISGSWKHLNIDGLEWQRKIRAEWDDDAPLA